jgi:hypothetical protein
MNWLLDELWSKQSMPLFLPLPPPPQLLYSNNNSPENSFLDYMYPVIDRLVRNFFFLTIMIYLFFNSRQHLPVTNYLIILICIQIEQHIFPIPQ